MTRDVVAAFGKHDLHMQCLCGLGDINTGLGVALEQGVTQWIMDLLHASSVQQVSAYAHAYYVTVVKRSCVDVVEPNFISGFILDHPERSFHDFRVCLRNDEKLTPIINCHAPTSAERTLTQ